MCNHPTTQTRNLYDQRPPSQGRELRPTYVLCTGCGTARLHPRILEDVIWCIHGHDMPATYATWTPQDHGTIVGLCDEHAHDEEPDTTLYMVAPDAEYHGWPIERPALVAS